RSLLSFHPPPIFFFNHPAPTAIYTLSLHDALPISGAEHIDAADARHAGELVAQADGRVIGEIEAVIFALRRTERHEHQDRGGFLDRKSTRLNSSHVKISYAVFCLKKKKKRIR